MSTLLPWSNIGHPTLWLNPSQNDYYKDRLRRLIKSASDLGRTLGGACMKYIRSTTSNPQVPVLSLRANA